MQTQGSFGDSYRGGSAPWRRIEHRMAGLYVRGQGRNLCSRICSLVIQREGMRDGLTSSTSWRHICDRNRIRHANATSCTVASRVWHCFVNDVLNRSELFIGIEIGELSPVCGRRITIVTQAKPRGATGNDASWLMVFGSRGRLGLPFRLGRMPLLDLQRRVHNECKAKSWLVARKGEELCCKSRGIPRRGNLPFYQAQPRSSPSPRGHHQAPEEGTRGFEPLTTRRPTFGTPITSSQFS